MIMKKLFLIKIILIFLLFITYKTEAVSIVLDSPKLVVGQEEEFYVDVQLDTKGQSINGIEGSVSFIGGDLSFLRSENAKSIMDLWVLNPVIKKYSIHFMAISTYGFSGVIDPFNQEEKLPGLITRLFFKPNSIGEVLFTTSSFFLTLDDGLGTMIEIPPTSFSVSVEGNVSIQEPNNEIYSEPEIKAFVVQDENLFNNKYTLIFEAKDSETGIDKVLIKEGKRKWREIESPYLLKDQSRRSLISLRAINFSGQSVYLTIDPSPENSENKPNNFYIYLLLFVFILFILIKRTYPFKK